MQVVAIIGARSGSKGISDKNIKPLAGKPLMGWIIEAAKRSRLVNRVIVSTDSPRYAEIARNCGAETSFLRPPEISGDRATDFEYVSHALGWLKANEGYAPDMVVRLMPTTPLQSGEDIDECIERLLADQHAHASVVVAEAHQHPGKAMKLVSSGSNGPYLVGYASGDPRDAEPAARQQYEKAYFRANVVATRPWVIEQYQSLVGERALGHVIQRDRAVDIDAPIDFVIAEALLKHHGLS